MEWKISYTVPEQHIILEADNEIEADETARKVIDGITIEKSFRYQEIKIVGIEENVN